MCQTNVAEKIKTHFKVNKVFLYENRAACETMWKNMVRPVSAQMTIWRMRIACWITKATDTHSEYVILITFPQQQWLHDRVGMLCCTYIVCLVKKKLLPYETFTNLNQPEPT
jgi:hypothetical protein